MFANLKFRNEFAIAGTGIPPQLYVTGSVGGGIIPVTATVGTAVSNANSTFTTTPAGNYADFRKWVALVQLGSGASPTAAFNAWWGGASASGGTYSMLPATSTSTFTASASYNVITGQATSQFGSLAALVMEIRGEYLAGLGSNISWIRPIISVSNSSAYASCLALQFDSGSDPASNADNPLNYVLQETDAY